MLFSKDDEDRYRKTGEKPVPAAICYMVRNDSGDTRHFTIENGQVIEHADYKAAFGPMLFELHPTRGFHHAGEWCPIHRYSLCWAGYELYHPKTAEQLAALRVARERRRTERELEQFANDNPLLAWAERQSERPQDATS